MAPSQSKASMLSLRTCRSGGRSRSCSSARGRGSITLTPASSTASSSRGPSRVVMGVVRLGISALSATRRALGSVAATFVRIGAATKCRFWRSDANVGAERAEVRARRIKGAMGLSIDASLGSLDLFRPGVRSCARGWTRRCLVRRLGRRFASRTLE